MFTGIVEDTGIVRALAEAGDTVRVEIECATLAPGLSAGGSIAVNGCCLTAVTVAADAFTCDLTRETLARTGFDQRLRPGVLVNLERPLRADGRFDGHIVQGHVDGLGRIRALRRQGAAAELIVEVPAELDRYLVTKGSVAVDGISLTVAGREAGCFTAAVIPYTLARTNLAQARPGDPVNLEVDIIAKYVERLLQED
jgi:riboflavin synthase